MEPTLKPGTVVLGVPTRRVRSGDVVVIRHENMDKIKRVKEVDQGKVFLVGDNESQSKDSRDFGWLEIHLVLAKVIWPTTLSQD